MAKNKKSKQDKLYTNLSVADNQAIPGTMTPTQFLSQGFPNTANAQRDYITSSTNFYEDRYGCVTNSPYSIDKANLNTSSSTTFNNWITLLKTYNSNWVLSKIVDLPVDDGIKNIKITAKKGLDPEQVETLMYYIQRNNVLNAFKDACRFSLIFGGGVVVLQDLQHNNTRPVKKDSEIVWRAIDLWQCNQVKDQNIQQTYSFINDNEVIFNWNGQPLNKNRGIAIKGNIAPNYYQSITRGWGTPIFDYMMAPINEWNRFQNVLFEALKSANIDVITVQSVEAIFSNPQSISDFHRQVREIAKARNIAGILPLSENQTLDRKGLDVAGIVSAYEVYIQQLCAASRIPKEKLLGESAKGINNGGEASMVEYGTHVDSLRARWNPPLVKVCEQCCVVLFGYIPEELTVTFESIRPLSPDQQIAKNNASLEVLYGLYDRQLITQEELQQKINELNIFETPFEMEGSGEIIESSVNEETEETEETEEKETDK